MEPEELRVIHEIEQLDNEEYLEASTTAQQMRAYVGGNAEAIEHYTVISFDLMSALLSRRQRTDSLNLILGNNVSPNSHDSMQSLFLKREELISELDTIRDNYYEKSADQIRILINATVINQSSARTAIVAPCLLRVEFEERSTDLRLNLAGSRSSLTMLGVKMMSMGPPTSSINAHSHETITFVTESKASLGDRWSFFEKALEQAGARASIIYQAIDGSVHQSEMFAFSKDFGDELQKKLLKKLEESN